MTAKLKTEAYKIQNEMCARIILSDPQRYPAGGLMAQWAELVLKRTRTAVERDPGPLFRTSNLSEAVKGRNHE